MFGKKENWPEGTEIKKTSEGKTEITLPTPMTGKKIEKITKPHHKKRKEILKTPSQKSSNIDAENKLEIEKERLFYPKKYKKTHPRQEQLRQEKKEERKFRKEV